MKIRQVRAQLFYANGQTNMTMLTDPLRNFAEAHRKSVGHVVAQLVEALRYKPVARGFDSR